MSDRRKILIADDEPDILGYLESQLRRKYDVALAGDGADAIVQFRTERIDILLTDVRMPGIDGIQLLRAVKELAPRCQVILMSGHSDLHMVIDGINNGAFAFVTKPLEMTAVLTRIEQAVTQIRGFEDQEAVMRELKRDLMHQTAFSQRLSALAALTGSLGHELAQPLSGINVYAQTLGEMLASGDVVDAEYAGQLIEKIQQQVERATDVVDHVKEFTADADDSAPATLDLKAAVERAVDLFRVQLQSRGIALIIDVPAGLGVIANRNQFEQVTINLVSNARDSVIDKADSNGDGAPKEIRIQAAQDQSWVSIEVRDTGSGIEPRLQRDLFEPFVTTKQDHGGSGLGLFICQELAERMGGELVLLESSQAGTAFRLRLRAASAAP